MVRLLLSTSLLLLICTGLRAQYPSSNSNGYDRNYPHRIIQASFLPSMSTNGEAAPWVINHLSFNFLGGIAGGLEGLEIGLAYNEDRGFMRGMQVAGIMNKVGGDVTGLQVGGLVNLNDGSLSGLSIAGLYGHQHGVSAGMQVAGLVANSDNEVMGSQLAGLVCISRYKMIGAQVSGISNIAGDVTGLQLSGIFNKARKVKGVQIGLINVAESVKGVPIGLLSIVRQNGYRRFEISGGESLHLQATYKIGVRHFYNQFSIGFHFGDQILDQPESGNFSGTSYGLGLGIGSGIHISGPLYMNIDLMAYHINESLDSWTKDLNLLNQAKLTFSLAIGERLEFFAGPVYNLMVSQTENALSRENNGLAPSWVFFDEVVDGGNTRVQQWVGLNLGMRF